MPEPRGGPFGSLFGQDAFNPKTYRRDYRRVTIPGQDGTFDLTNLNDLSYYVRTMFEEAGMDGEFAARVLSGEHGGEGINAVGDGGHSLGPWQLYDEALQGQPVKGGGLRREFIEWANRVGENPDPFDPIATTAYVVQKIAGDPAAWGNWTVARTLMEQGVTPSDAPRPVGAQDTPLDWARYGQDERVLEERTLQDRIAQMLNSSTEQRQGIEGILSALLQASPLVAPPGMTHLPGLEPYGAGQQWGNMLGVNVPPAPLGRMSLPVSLLSGASPLSPQAIQQQYGGLR